MVGAYEWAVALIYLGLMEFDFWERSIEKMTLLHTLFIL